MSKDFEDSFRRARALLASLTTLIQCAMDVEDNSQQLGSCQFLLTELVDSIAALEDQIRGWSTASAPAND